jgi:UDP-N-acetylmuramate--alanine ligase
MKTKENRSVPGSIPAGAGVHFIGIGGIGMSGLAQLYAKAGYRVSGSDRGAENPENQRIIQALRQSGIAIYPQDGSFVRRHKADYMVYSSAIEKDNADFIAGEGIPCLHRSEALAIAMNTMTGHPRIAVSGSCGKTTVTAWLAESMFLAGRDPSFLNGGLVNRFCAPDNAGNYYHGTGGAFVFEADESDKSLTIYEPDYALLLNIGTDHYSKDELAAVFSAFVRRVKTGIVVEKNVLEMLEHGSYAHLQVRVFTDGPAEYHNVSAWGLSDYSCSSTGATAVINDGERIALPMPGRHNAMNALAIAAMMDMLGIDKERIVAALPMFKGVWRRNDYAGRMTAGARVYDDYAHNVEKIASCIAASVENTDGKIFAVFQPHGFGPLGFMREELLPALEKVLRPQDTFIFLPPYYAGGTSSFKPTTQEVVDDYKQRSQKRFLCFSNRIQAEQFLNAATTNDDVVLIMGARDNSLSDWAKQLTRKGKVV